MTAAGAAGMSCAEIHIGARSSTAAQKLIDKTLVV
jgi:hypothetical protein